MGQRLVLLGEQITLAQEVIEAVFVDVLGDVRLAGFGPGPSVSPRLLPRTADAVDYAYIGGGELQWGTVGPVADPLPQGGAPFTRRTRTRQPPQGTTWTRVEPQRVGGNPSLLLSAVSAADAGLCQLLHLRDDNLEAFAPAVTPFENGCRAVAPMNRVAATQGVPLMRLLVRLQDAYRVYSGELR